MMGLTGGGAASTNLILIRFRIQTIICFFFFFFLSMSFTTPVLRSLAVVHSGPAAIARSISVARTGSAAIAGLHTTGYRGTRTFATSPSRLASLSNQDVKPTSSSPSSGVNGQHQKLQSAHNMDTAPPLFKGDWVLFHPVYTPEELQAVEVLHRDAKTLGDKFASGLVRITRRLFDLVSGYKHKHIGPDNKMSLEELRKAGYILDEQQWLIRILFLETIAGVPGMVAATVRHLSSLRLMRRDSGWIHTLLQEAENERMHLMTFMKIKQPSLFFRLIILGAQGVYYNLFFLAYLMSPRICHRFVGYLEEEAVMTYTRCIKDLEAGRLPAWSNMPAPDVAKDYWRLKDDAKLLDVLYAVRSDETTHRFVNHSLANLEPKTDVNPFALREPDMHVKGHKAEFSKDEAEKYIHESQIILQEGKGKSATSA